MNKFVSIKSLVDDKLFKLKELIDVIRHDSNLNMQEAACIRVIEKVFYSKKYALGENSLNVYIAGPTCSGKTTFAKMLESYFKSKGISVATIHQDDYFKDLNQISRCRGGYYMDAIDAFCVDEMVHDFGTLLDDGMVRVPDYDIKSNTRIGYKPAITRGKINIVEGLHVIEIFKYDLNGIYFYMDTPIDVCLSRRTKRDTKKYGISEARIKEYFNECIVPMYERDILPQRQIEGLVRCYTHIS